MSGSLISPDLRARVRALAEPVAAAFGRLGLTPNHLTLIGFGIALVAALVAAMEAWLAAGLLVLFGGAFDLLDGALARTSGRVSRFGGFMDSVFDRWGEGVVYVGIAWGCATAGFGVGAVLAAAALTMAFMVSYARAKSESLGFTPGRGMANVGLAPREVRIVVLAIGLVVVGLIGGVARADSGACSVTAPSCSTDAAGWGAGANLLAGVLGFIALLATITTIQRILHVRAQAKEG